MAGAFGFLIIASCVSSSRMPQQYTRAGCQVARQSPRIHYTIWFCTSSTPAALPLRSVLCGLRPRPGEEREGGIPKRDRPTADTISVSRVATLGSVHGRDWRAGSGVSSLRTVAIVVVAVPPSSSPPSPIRSPSPRGTPRLEHAPNVTPVPAQEGREEGRAGAGRGGDVDDTTRRDVLGRA